MSPVSNASTDGEKKSPWLGVEPAMFLYTLGFRLVFVIEEAFFIHRACTTSFPFYVCQNLSEYTNYSLQVQIMVSSFHQYNNVGLLVIPACLILFLGAWSDRVGRKAPLLLGLFGYFIYTLMMIVISSDDSWRLESIFYMASIPGSLTGRDWTIYMACFAYLADTTTPQSRTYRTYLLATSYLLPIPLGVAIGSYLFNGPLNGSYAAMFLTSAGLQVVAILYTLLAIPWKTSTSAKTSGCSPLAVLRDTLTSLCMKRPSAGRLFLLLSVLAGAIAEVVREESKMIQLYTIWKFNWTVESYSLFKTVESSVFVFGLLVVAPMIQRVFKLEDCYILIIGASSYIIGRIAFISAQSPTLLYIGILLEALGPVINPVSRSIISKTVSLSERGKIFAVIGIAELLVRYISSVGYSQIYINTINVGFPQGFLLLSIISLAIIISIGVVMHFKKGCCEEEIKAKA